MADKSIEINDESDDDILAPTLYGYKHGTNYNYQTLKTSFIGLLCLIIGVISGVLLAIRLYNIPSNTNHIFSTHNFASDSYNNIGAILSELRKNIKKRAARKNENECSERRCCLQRDNLTPNDIPKGLNCKMLSDEECGSADEWCIWDCNPPINLYINNQMNRHFRQISLQKGVPTMPTEIENIKEFNYTLEDCLAENTMITIDDCGVEYEVQFDMNEMLIYCQYHSQNNQQDSSIKLSKRRLCTEEASENLQRRLIVTGEDNRTQVTSTDYPYSTVFYMNFDKPTGSVSRCTATMISPNWAITAAHCIYGSGDFYSDWKLYANVLISADKDCENQFKTNLRVMPLRYANYSTWDYDIAWLRVTETVMNVGELQKLKYLDFGYDNTFNDKEYFNIISYPADKSSSTKWYQYCAYDNPWRTHTMNTFECDTSGGASGSSIYKYWPGELEYDVGTRIVYGIHTKGACYSENGTYLRECNTATRITPGFYHAICNYVELNDPFWCNGIHIREWLRDNIDSEEHLTYNL